MTTKFGTKADTLASLEGNLSCAHVLPQVSVTLKEWKANKHLSKLISEPPSWLDSLVIVRSSALAEDKLHESMAGQFLSVSKVLGSDEIDDAIEDVFRSYSDSSSLEDQVFIQPMLENVKISGVVFSRDPANGSHYFIVNYDDVSGETDTVTSGKSNHTKTLYQSKTTAYLGTPWLKNLFDALIELEAYCNCDSLDVEFAIDAEDRLVILQVRQLTLPKGASCWTLKEQQHHLQEIQNKIKDLSLSHPYLYGNKGLFGVMPDWNPAEIIGIRPRSLALSLYKELITDGTWAYQRDNYGYRNLRSFPLIVSLCGMPYIDVRVSFNSFIPNSLDEEVAERLVDYYLNTLIETPSNHDKVEFEIIISCYTLDLPDQLLRLHDHGFTKQDIRKFTESLRKLTNNIINNEDGLWKKDIQKIEELKDRQDTIQDSSLPIIDKIYWLIEDCKRYGTLPFAGLARAGFIAVQLLRSLVNVKVLSEDEYQKFLASLTTVSSEISENFQVLSKELFIQKYGHLRPGTYDVLSPRYDEDFESYFGINYSAKKSTQDASNLFSLGLDAMNKIEVLLKEHGLDHTALGLLNFIKKAIEGREYAKFVFTKSLSNVLELMKELGAVNGFSSDDVSYANINIIQYLYSSSENIKSTLDDSIRAGKNIHQRAMQISLPPLITGVEDIDFFELPTDDPNFITLKVAAGQVVNDEITQKSLVNSILFIQSADPGFDWIFSRKIAGFVTMFGGANSHMAIRASELGIPAVIGAGKVLYDKWSAADFIKIDCANKKVYIVE